MKDRHSLWFRVIALTVVCLFTTNNFVFALDLKDPTAVYTLAPTSRFNPAFVLEWKNGEYVIRKDPEEVARLKGGLKEDAVFVGLNLLFGQYLNRSSRRSRFGMSDRGLKRDFRKFKICINKHFPYDRNAPAIERFRTPEMTFDGNTIHLPYRRKDSTREDPVMQTLKYYLPEAGQKRSSGGSSIDRLMASLNRLVKVEIPTGVGDDTVILEDPQRKEKINVTEAKQLLYDTEKLEIARCLTGILKKRFADITPEDRIAIDVGAGDGNITERIGSFFKTVHVIEKDPECGDALRSRNIEGLKLHQGDFFEFLQSIPQNEFADFILMSHSISLYFPRKERNELLKKTMALLKNDGVLALVLNGNQVASGNNVEIRQRFMQSHRMIFKGEKTNMEDRLKEWGYKVEVEPVRIIHETASRNEMIRMASVFIPPKDRQKKDFTRKISDYVDRNLKIPGTNIYRLTVDEEILLVSPPGSASFAVDSGHEDIRRPGRKPSKELLEKLLPATKVTAVEFLKTKEHKPNMQQTHANLPPE
ncbi:MAG: methyltransferase domain-containing protein, partial [Candidatus Omnitrophica bacterium]|nr:methyltransferase domain-containing protein [Candidatus Omnitrophota bacterium]